MKNFSLLIKHEFFKLRNTMAFRSSWIIPLAINSLITLIFIIKADDFLKLNSPNIWFTYLEFILGIMGSLILPIYLIFLTFSVNDIEHKSDTWKNLFSFPMEKRQVFFSKWLSTVFIFGIFMFSFYLFTYLAGISLAQINPSFGFQNHAMGLKIFELYTKMFLASIALLSFQFFLSMLWSDFMKSMGIGFLLTIGSLIALRWEYIYVSPYAQPMYSIMNLFKKDNPGTIAFDSIEIWVGLGTAVVFILLSYRLMKNRSVR